MADETCALCGSKLISGSGHTTILSEEERAILANPLESFSYCDPCHRLMLDPNSASSLLSNLIAAHLRQLGVFPTLSHIERFKAKLIALASKRKT